MSKLLIHTRFLFRYGCLVLLLAHSPAIHAQEKEDTIVVLDTLINTTPEEFSEETVFFFDKATPVQAVQVRRVPDSILNALKNDEDFWYAKMPPHKKNSDLLQNKSQDPNTSKSLSPGKTPFYRLPWFKSILWIIIICTFVAIVVWYLSISNVQLFRKASTSLDDEGSSKDLDDIFAINYEQEITKAINAKNYRLATRLLYLQTLRLLSDHGIIQYKAERTNSDYMAQLFGTSYYKDFFRITRDFDYTWYGKFEISEAAFQIIQNDFTNFKNRLPQ